MSTGVPLPPCDDIRITSDAAGGGRNAAFKSPSQQASGNQSDGRNHSRDRQRSKSRDRSRSSDRKNHDNRGQQHGGSRGWDYDKTGGQYSNRRGHNREKRNYEGTNHGQGRWQNQSYGGLNDRQQGSYGFPGPSGNSGWNYGGQTQYQRNADGEWSEDDYTFLSRTLSSILRHNAEKFGFKLMKGGFLYVDEILHNVKRLHGFELRDVHKVVQNNDKKRFALEKEENGRWKIRANQGHSLEVECLDLKPITSADEYPMVIHGTYYEAWEKIKTTGLRRMKRNHIHFAAGLPGSGGVISGMRSSCEVIISINMEKALQDGLKFFVSANNVILSEGDKDGIIYPCYFQGARDRRLSSRMEFDGNISSSSAQSSEPQTKKQKKKKNKKKNRDHSDERAVHQGDSVDEHLNTDSSMNTDDTPSHEDAADAMKQTVEETNASMETVDNTNAEIMKPTVDETNTKKEIVGNADPVVENIGYGMEDMDVTDTKTKDNWDDEDIPVQWNSPEFMKASTSADLVDNLIESGQSSVVVCCVGENLGKKESCIRAIVLFICPNIYVYHLIDDNKDLVKDGKLDTLLLAKDVTKVFFNISPVSHALIQEYDILMSHTPVWDIELMVKKVTLPHMDKEELKETYDFTDGSFKKWKKENEKSSIYLANPDIDGKSLDFVLEQGKCITELFKMCSRKLDDNMKRSLKGDVYKAVEELVGDDLENKVAELKLKNKKPKHANKTTENPKQQEQQQQSSKQQNKQSGGNKGKRGKKSNKS